MGKPCRSFAAIFDKQNRKFEKKTVPEICRKSKRLFCYLGGGIFFFVSRKTQREAYGPCGGSAAEHAHACRCEQHEADDCPRFVDQRAKRVLQHNFETVFINTSCQIPEHCEKLQTHTCGPVLKTNVKHYASTTRSVNASITRIRLQELQ